MAEQRDIKTGKYLKDFLEKQHEYYEVLLPNEFTPKQPWGSFPEEKWIDQELSYPECLLSEDLTTHIPIYRVSHITHNKQADSIDSTLSDGYYNFKPKAKLGRQKLSAGIHYRRTVLGQTYKQNESGGFQLIEHSERNPVFPGYLSWWEIDVQPFYQKLEGRRLLHHIAEIKKKGYYMPNCLNEEISSIYGNRSYSIALSDLLTSYQAARSDQSRSEIQLRVGGTLLYKQEICYVAVVCLTGDQELASMPAMDDRTVFKHNGLLNDKGVVINRERTPEFRAANIIHGLEDIRFNWEQLVFALYFPDQRQCLTCKRQLVDTDLVSHDKPYCKCISTQPPLTRGKWLCPNKLSTS